MLKPTSQAIADAAALLVSNKLTPEQREDVASVIAQHPDVIANPLAYADVNDRLLAISGYRAQQVVAGLELFDSLGRKSATVQVQGLLTRRKDDERGEVVRYLIGRVWPPDDPAAAAASNDMASGDLADPTAGCWYQCCGAYVCICGRWAC